MGDNDFILLGYYCKVHEITNTELTTKLTTELGLTQRKINESNARLRDACYIEAVVYNEPQRKLKYMVTPNGENHYETELFNRTAGILPREKNKIHWNNTFAGISAVCAIISLCVLYRSCNSSNTHPATATHQTTKDTSRNTK